MEVALSGLWALVLRRSFYWRRMFLNLSLSKVEKTVEGSFPLMMYELLIVIVNYLAVPSTYGTF